MTGETWEDRGTNTTITLKLPKITTTTIDWLSGTKNDKNDIKLKDNLISDNKLWTTVKDMTDSCNKTPPRHIDY